jgi:hypothetical protein
MNTFESFQEKVEKLCEISPLLGQDAIDDLLVDPVVEMDHPVAESEDRPELEAGALGKMTGLLQARQDVDAGARRWKAKT